MVPTQDPSNDTPASGPARSFAARLAWLLVALGLVAVVGFVTWQGMARPRAAETAGDRDVVTIAIDGMSCVGCAGAVTTTIEEVPGVAEVTVDYESRVARVRLAGDHVAPATVVAAIEQAGYRAQLEPSGR